MRSRWRGPCELCPVSSPSRRSRTRVQSCSMPLRRSLSSKTQWPAPIEPWVWISGPHRTPVPLCRRRLPQRLDPGVQGCLLRPLRPVRPRPSAATHELPDPARDRAHLGGDRSARRPESPPRSAGAQPGLCRLPPTGLRPGVRRYSSGLIGCLERADIPAVP